MIESDDRIPGPVQNADRKLRARDPEIRHKIRALTAECANLQTSQSRTLQVPAYWYRNFL